MIPATTWWPQVLQALSIRKGTNTTPNSIPATWVIAFTFSSLISRSGLQVFMTNYLELQVFNKMLCQPNWRYRLTSIDPMNALFKKLLVLLPVALLTIFYLKAHYRDEYRHAATRRLLLFALTILLLYGWMFLN